MSAFTFWGVPCRQDSSEAGNSIGATIDVNGRRTNLTFAQLAAANKIAGAGADGLPIDDVGLTNVHVLKDAGLDIRGAGNGLRWTLSSAPVPVAYITPVEPPKREPVTQTIFRRPQR